MSKRQLNFKWADKSLDSFEEHMPYDFETFDDLCDELGFTADTVRNSINARGDIEDGE